MEKSWVCRATLEFNYRLGWGWVPNFDNTHTTHRTHTPHTHNTHTHKLTQHTFLTLTSHTHTQFDFDFDFTDTHFDSEKTWVLAQNLGPDKNLGPEKN